jgi:hypothetical protein
VVKACQQLGFQSPLDVRWWRMSQFRSAWAERSGVRSSKAWQWLFGGGLPREPTCTCGQPLPLLEKYTFTFVSERTAGYWLGQCRRCHLIFWEEASSSP